MTETATPRSVRLHGRIVLHATIHLLSGLHIGGAAGALEIGGVDKPVIRNPITDQPYIPGSSLKGKIRSLLEKACNAPQNQKINKDVYIHLAENAEQYRDYPICSIFGTLPQHPRNRDFSTPTPTRLTVRDVPLTEQSEAELRKLRTDLPYTEVKWEAAIDRVTSAATPRQIERVPAGAKFGTAEFIYSVYTAPDTPSAAEVAAWFVEVVKGMRYLEHDYLGGMGTRGSGQVRFEQVRLHAVRIQPGSADTTTPFEIEQDETKGISVIDEQQLTEWLTTTFAKE